MSFVHRAIAWANRHDRTTAEDLFVREVQTVKDELAGMRNPTEHIRRTDQIAMLRSQGWYEGRDGLWRNYAYGGSWKLENAVKEQAKRPVQAMLAQGYRRGEAGRHADEAIRIGKRMRNGEPIKTPPWPMPAPCGDTQYRGGPCHLPAGHEGNHEGFVDKEAVYATWGDAVGTVRSTPTEQKLREHADRIEAVGRAYRNAQLTPDCRTCWEEYCDVVADVTGAPTDPKIAKNTFREFFMPDSETPGGWKHGDYLGENGEWVRPGDWAFRPKVEEKLVVQADCDRLPAGWRCSRERGHEGPCAAIPIQTSSHYVTDVVGNCAFIDPEDYDRILIDPLGWRGSNSVRMLVTERDYLNAALDASSFVESAEMGDVRGIDRGVEVQIRGLGGHTPNWLMSAVQRHLTERAPINTFVYVTERPPWLI